LVTLGEAAGGDDAVDVRMESELLVPGVQDGGESDGGLELGSRDFGQRLGDSLEEESQARLGRPAEERVKLSGNGEDDLEVDGGQEQGFLRLGPQSLLEDLALGTVAIPAGIVRAAGEAAGGTHFEMAAEPLGAASDDVAHGPLLGSAQAQALRVVA